jgi:uncharacterized protein (TIGR00296 family)
MNEIIFSIDNHIDYLPFYCFNTLDNHFNNLPDPIPNFPDSSFPLFVSYHKNNNLRGCIGNFSSLSLHKGLRDYAKIAAFQDTRFNPLTRDEMMKGKGNFTCSVSLLTDFEKGENYLDWNLGEHGIRINISSYSATFLPEVAAEQNWTKEETINALLSKAGVGNQMIDKERISLVRYKSVKKTCSLQEYLNKKM